MFTIKSKIHNIEYFYNDHKYSISLEEKSATGSVLIELFISVLNLNTFAKYEEDITISKLRQNDENFKNFHDVKNIIESIKHNIKEKTVEIIERVNLVELFFRDEFRNMNISFNIKVGKKDIEVISVSNLDEINKVLNDMKSEIINLKNDNIYLKLENKKLKLNVESLNQHIQKLTGEECIEQKITHQSFIKPQSKKSNKLLNEFSEFNETYFELSNNNRTIKKLDSNWRGGYCRDRIIFDNTIKEFSIYIDHTYNCDIKLGFALHGFSNHTTLHYNTHGSWFIYLFNGLYYYGGSCQNAFFIEGKYTPPKNGDTVSFCIDTYNNVFFLKLNGEIWSDKVMFHMDEDQKNRLYPSVDMCTENDQISLV